MFDTHAHVFDGKLINQIDKILKQAESLNFEGIICICENEKDVDYYLNYYHNYKFLYCSIGVHPHNAKIYSENLLKTLFKKLYDTGRLVAIGEIGLDFYYNFSSYQQQVDAFVSQIEFAKKYSLPIIIHSRNSNQQMYEIIEKYDVNSAVIHCINDDANFVDKIIKRGLYVGFTGVITFKNAKNYTEIIKIVPDEKILIETDSPYLTPEPMRGKINTPLNLKYIIQKVAEIKNYNYDTVEKITDQNAKKFFRII